MANANSNTKIDYQNQVLSDTLQDNVNLIGNIFSYPINKDFVVRNLHVLCINRSAALLCLNTIVDKLKVDNHIIGPLMYTKLDTADIDDDIGIMLKDRVISVKSIELLDKVPDIAKALLDGDTILLIEGYSKALLMYTAKLEHRNVEKSTIENTLKGPKESFTEWNEGNRSLIRKSLKNPYLVTEVVNLGEYKANEACLMYLKGVANPEVITKIKERLNKIRVESIERSPLLEQWIEDRPYSIIPSTFATERPDRVSSLLKEGHIAIVLDSSSNVIILPVTFWTFFHTSEDMYERWLYGNFLRTVRMIALFVTLLLPGIYLAVTTYHSDMIPTDLIFAIASNRENLPFPVFMEMMLMEISFELIREAGVRIPTNIGPTIGIVGALILGQAAVQANIVSPILVIIVALTGLSSFAVPELNLSFIVRIGRFVILAAGALGGFYGVGLLSIAFLAYTSVCESFGVPFFSPKAPYYPSAKDLIFRKTIFKQKQRPMNIEPLDDKK